MYIMLCFDFVGTYKTFIRTYYSNFILSCILTIYCFFEFQSSINIARATKWGAMFVEQLRGYKAVEMAENLVLTWVNTRKVMYIIKNGLRNKTIEH